MKQATFSEGVGVALVASVTVAALFSVMSSLFMGGSLFKMLVSGLSFFYISYLLLRSDEKAGRITVLVSWLIVSFATFIFVPSFLLYLAIQLFMVWLVRSLYFYNSVLSALVDLFVTSMSVVIAMWALNTTGSVFLTFWSFFLVQALFVYIPKSIVGNKEKVSHMKNQGDKFEHAHHAAELAVARLAGSR